MKKEFKKKLWRLLERYGLWQKAKHEWEIQYREEFFKDLLNLLHDKRYN